MSEFSKKGIIYTIQEIGTRAKNENDKDLVKCEKERNME